MYKSMYTLHVYCSIYVHVYYSIPHSRKFWRELNLANLLFLFAKIKICQIESSCTSSMAHGHKFTKLKLAKTKKLAIRKNLLPPKFLALQYMYLIPFSKICVSPFFILSLLLLLLLPVNLQ